MVSTFIINLAKKIINKVLNDVKIPKEDIYKMIDEIDTNGDGTISADEMIDAVLTYVKK